MTISAIDLHHAETISDALDTLERELFYFFQEKETIIRVIHGIGTGALAAAVHTALEKNPMIKSREESEDGGSCIVRL
jgi:dsDNA-specific endonuclease/ATPase MutS2